MKAICPYCFNSINLNKLDLRCSSKSHRDPNSTERHIIKRKNAKVDFHGYCKCDEKTCNCTTRTLVCNYCNKDLPDTIRESETKIISIVGAKGSGKSYFVATLLRQIMEEGLLARVNHAATRFNEGSREIYETRYKSNLDSRSPLPGTNYVNDIVRDNPPILANISYVSKKGKKIDNTYSFFDAAGESFASSADLAAITPYISHSEAIILILDPRQISKINEVLTDAMPGLPPVTKDKYEDTINSVADVLYNNLRLSRNKQIDIPVCVAFSKWDLLINTPGLIPTDLMVSKPSSSSTSGFNLAQIENASAEIRSLLNEWDPNFLLTVEGKFKTVCYFGFSAWGPGSKNGTDIPAIASFRVEDPMLWIMNMNKLL